jgi:hypothetical protein|tara:strand:+ start:164 stop:295 length:132 start_codon:yes stop_codon:yes gene_type:complete
MVVSEQSNKDVYALAIDLPQKIMSVLATSEKNEVYVCRNKTTL